MAKRETIKLSQARMPEHGVQEAALDAQDLAGAPSESQQPTGGQRCLSGGGCDFQGPHTVTCIPDNSSLTLDGTNYPPVCIPRLGHHGGAVIALAWPFSLLLRTTQTQMHKSFSCCHSSQGSVSQFLKKAQESGVQEKMLAQNRLESHLFRMKHSITRKTRRHKKDQQFCACKLFQALQAILG